MQFDNSNFRKFKILSNSKIVEAKAKYTQKFIEIESQNTWRHYESAFKQIGEFTLDNDLKPNFYLICKDYFENKEFKYLMHLCVASNEKIRIGLTLGEKEEREIQNEKLKSQITSTIKNKLLKEP